MPDNSQLDRPYPSDPSTRYRQGRVGQPQQGTTQNAVWTVTLNATGGLWAFAVTNGGTNKPLSAAFGASSGFATVSPVANAATMQAAFEVYVGAGNVTVTGGPGASGGGTPYVVTFVGQLAGQPIEVAGLATFLSGGGAAQTVTHTTVGGRPSASTPIGPAYAPSGGLPANSPVAREA
jgi:hypothetical protein